MGGVVKSVTGGVKSIGKGIGNVAGGAVKVASSAVKGESLDKGFDRMGGGLKSATSGYLNVATGGQGKLIDQYTGGAFTKMNTAYEGFGNFVQGKSVDENIKAQLSLVAQAGQTAIGSGAVGTNIGGFDAGGLLNNILGGVQNKLDGIKMPSGNPANNAPSMQSGSYGGQVAQKNYTPFIVVGAIILVGIVLVIKKKK